MAMPGGHLHDLRKRRLMNVQSRYHEPGRMVRARGGYTLLELVAVLLLLGMLAGLTARLAPDLADMASRVDSRKLALDLEQARRRAISTGDNHLLVFQQSGGAIVGYTVHRRIDVSTTEAVDQYRPFADELTVSVSPGNPEFTFEGAATAACTITVTGSDKVQTLSVLPATGAIAISESAAP